MPNELDILYKLMNPLAKVLALFPWIAESLAYAFWLPNLTGIKIQDWKQLLIFVVIASASLLLDESLWHPAPNINLQAKELLTHTPPKLTFWQVITRLIGLPGVSMWIGLSIHIVPSEKYFDLVAAGFGVGLVKYAFIRLCAYFRSANQT